MGFARILDPRSGHVSNSNKDYSAAYRRVRDLFLQFLHQLIGVVDGNIGHLFLEKELNDKHHD